jgi:hypothetical protein
MIPAETSVLWPRLRAAALTAVFILTIVAGFVIKETPPSYVESATVLFELPAGDTAASAYSRLGPSLIATGQVISQIVMSPQSRTRIQARGGSANYSLALNNIYNQDYPYYSYPEATLTTSSLNVTSTGRTFSVAARLVSRILAARQEKARVPSADRITARIIGDPQPTASAGSRKRALAGLAVLAAVAIAWVRSYFSQPALATRKHLDPGG